MSASHAYLLGTVFAGVSALALWATVWQVRRIQRTARLPSLHGQLTHPRDAQHVVRLRVTNAGGGLARAVHVAIVGETHAIDPAVGRDAVLRSGESGSIGVHLPVDPPPRAVIVCRDVDEFVRAWTLDGQAKVYRRRLRRWKPAYPSTPRILAGFYPDVGDFTKQRLATESVGIDA